MKIFPIVLLLLGLQTASATTFYISPGGNDILGNGSRGNPWHSLLKATAVASKPGDIIHVLPGTYIEHARCNLAPGVSIEGEGDNCIIQSTLSEAFVPIIVATSEEGTMGNQSISKLLFDGNNQVTSAAIGIAGRSNFSVNNCTIKNFEDYGVSFSGISSVTAPGAPKIYATGNSFYKNKVTNCAKYDTYGRGCLQFGGQNGMLVYDNYLEQSGRPFAKNGWPIKMANEGYVQNCKIYNNTIVKQPYRGNYGGEDGWNFSVELWNVEGLEIYGNKIQGAVDISNCTKGNSAFGMYVHDNEFQQPTLPFKSEDGIILETTETDVIIKNNKFINITTGIVFAPHDYENKGIGIDVHRITIENNVFENLGIVGGNDGFGIRWHNIELNPLTYVSDIFVVNNKFTASPDDNAAGTGIQLPAYKSTRKATGINLIKNTIKGFQYAAIAANPADNIDSLILKGNEFYNNGNSNKPLFIGGHPAVMIDENNKSAELESFHQPSFNFKQQIIKPLYYDLKRTTIIEIIAVLAGILSVWFSKKENIYVYPVGLINTVIYVFLSLDSSLFGEASVNLYYTIMSIYGWIIWSKRDKRRHRLVRVTTSTLKEWLIHLAFFATFYIALFFSLTYLKTNFSPGAIPWADSFASATAFTGMWLMTKKKVESWYWWIATNMASIPLYFVKHFALTSAYYCVLLVLAFMGLQEWKKRAKTTKRI